jgi:hypothetical protein
VAIAHTIPVHLDRLAQFDSCISTASSWYDRAAKTFLKKHSTFTLLEVSVHAAISWVQLVLGDLSFCELSAITGWGWKVRFFFSESLRDSFAVKGGANTQVRIVCQTSLHRFHSCMVS